MKRRERMIGEFAAFGAAICWTISAVLYRRALSETKPVPANIVRLACTSLILIAFLIAIGKFQTLIGLPVYAVLLACFSGVIGLGLGDTLYMVSLKLVGVARAVSITCTYPLFSILVAVFLQGNSVTLQTVVGAIAIVFGIWLLTREEESRKSGSYGNALVKGAIVAVAAAVMWALSIAMINIAVTLPETSSLDGALVLNTVRVSSVAAFLLASAPLTDRNFGFLKVQRKTLVLLILGGLVALGLGWFFLAFSFLYISEAEAVPISSISPLFAVLSGLVFLNERVTRRNVAGSVIIVLGVSLLFVRVPFL